MVHTNIVKHPLEVGKPVVLETPLAMHLVDEYLTNTTPVDYYVESSNGWN